MSIKPVSDLYLITYEDGTPYKSTRDAKEAVDAIGAGFKVEEFISLENHRAAMLQDEPVTTANKLGNPPVIPDGYVMVPKEMTDEIGEAIAMQANCCGGIALDIYDALLAAAPHSPGSELATVPGKWIPVSERMPESNGMYFGWDGKRVLEVYCFFGGFSANQFIHGEITHWMPLPAAPQEPKP
ncbi:TPA: DUF551 domain-containing protein [Klebsiella quasipneumoniae subsp. similipneumoniae]|nr:DUF551 domain-containing protein [Klebsiella quasipneumoniae subsp. similipneumoniae]